MSKPMKASLSKSIVAEVAGIMTTLATLEMRAHWEDFAIPH